MKVFVSEQAHVFARLDKFVCAKSKCFIFSLFLVSSFTIVFILLYFNLNNYRDGPLHYWEC